MLVLKSLIPQYMPTRMKDMDLQLNYADLCIKIFDSTNQKREITLAPSETDSEKNSNRYLKVTWVRITFFLGFRIKISFLAIAIPKLFFQSMEWDDVTTELIDSISADLAKRITCT